VNELRSSESSRVCADRSISVSSSHRSRSDDEFGHSHCCGRSSDHARSLAGRGRRHRDRSRRGSDGGRRHADRAKGCSDSGRRRSHNCRRHTDDSRRRSGGSRSCSDSSRRRAEHSHSLADRYERRSEDSGTSAVTNTPFFDDSMKALGLPRVPTCGSVGRRSSTPQSLGWRSCSRVRRAPASSRLLRCAEDEALHPSPLRPRLRPRVVRLQWIDGGRRLGTTRGWTS